MFRGTNITMSFIIGLFVAFLLIILTDMFATYEPPFIPLGEYYMYPTPGPTPSRTATPTVTPTFKPNLATELIEKFKIKGATYHYENGIYILKPQEALDESGR